MSDSESEDKVASDLLLKKQWEFMMEREKSTDKRISDLEAELEELRERTEKLDFIEYIHGKVRDMGNIFFKQYRVESDNYVDDLSAKYDKYPQPDLRIMVEIEVRCLHYRSWSWALHFAPAERFAVADLRRALHKDRDKYHQFALSMSIFQRAFSVKDSQWQLKDFKKEKFNEYLKDIIDPEIRQDLQLLIRVKASTWLAEEAT